jgi:UDP-N-acetylglucosamine--N-acetylmuramyl-(pentapeptide) pyrophosphoryl-undecaprenol N-acetylglucosamine transferase
LRILFTTSNGTGLGHLTRSMAIARRLGEGDEALFLTLSAAAPVVEQMGFPVEYVASYTTPATGNDYRWSRRLRSRLRVVIAEADPDIVVFDGTHPYEALLGALPQHARVVWCRRPMWKRGSSTVPLKRAGAFDAVLEPGELAESLDAGPTVALRDSARRVAPVVLLDRSELLPRAEAAAALGLDPDATTVLVSLGQGPEVREANRVALAALAGRPDVQVAALSSTLERADDVPAGVVALSATYPMSRYFAAIDACVAAAGYNAFHELIALGVPSLFVPMPRKTDDQRARARWAESEGLGLAVEGPADPQLGAAIERLLAEREAIDGRLNLLTPPDGAAAAAAWLATLPQTADEPAGREGEAPQRYGSAREFRRRWGSFFASLPQTAWRLGRQLVMKPPTRAIILAFEIDGDVAAAVREAIETGGEKPNRVLVVTDALQELGALRALGCGVEHIPARGSREAEIAGGTYEAFRAARLELVCAERPKPRRIVVAAGGAPVP